MPASIARLSRSGGQVDRVEASEDRRAHYVLRVPPDRLDALMDSVAALGDVDTRSVSVEDVTDQMVDVEARLATLRASRDRLRQLMERSTTVSDVIAVERELARVQGELESLQARLDLLQKQVALSELVVRLKQRRVLGPLGFVAVGLGQLLEKLFIWR